MIYVKLYKKEIDFIDKSFNEYLDFLLEFGKAGEYTRAYRKYRNLKYDKLLKKESL